MANRSFCGEWYHNECMIIQVNVFWDKKYHMQWKCSFAENKLYENGNKGLICGKILVKSCAMHCYHKYLEL